jgi:hypothetical protein
MEKGLSPAMWYRLPSSKTQAFLDEEYEDRTQIYDLKKQSKLLPIESVCVCV